jgi:hypothetical protein
MGSLRPGVIRVTKFGTRFGVSNARECGVNDDVMQFITIFFPLCGYTLVSPTAVGYSDGQYGMMRTIEYVTPFYRICNNIKNWCLYWCYVSEEHTVSIIRAGDCVFQKNSVVRTLNLVFGSSRLDTPVNYAITVGTAVCDYLQKLNRYDIVEVYYFL